eukprot:TRINITY_DN5610_c0_g1_i2.p1 TRINITY_DN5610_c0_g1~~TRINITY_DN5610_c0_g1_i2.p1  ORF type:complete len:272 (-),score=42.80 TRINITY_DN5610_c0_g1_i2:170-946(-)
MSSKKQYHIPQEPLNQAIHRSADAILNADFIVFTSGAGLGVDSGLPDFRGPEGFWRAYPPMKHLGLEFSQMSNPKWFTRDPCFAWGFWSHRYHLYRDTEPHAGYDIMKRWGEELLDGRYFVCTSNVDGAWERKGFDTEKINEIHGSVRYMQCLDNCKDKIWSADDFVIPSHDEDFRVVGDLPQCKHCDNVIRPNVLMFGDWGFNCLREATQSDNFDEVIESLSPTDKVVVIEIGAGKAIPSIRHISEDMFPLYTHLIY